MSFQENKLSSSFSSLFRTYTIDFKITLGSRSIIKFKKSRWCDIYVHTIRHLCLQPSSFLATASIKGLVTDGNTKLRCRGFILALLQSTTAHKIDSEHTRDYKRLLLVFEAEILRVTVKINEIFSSFYVDL